MAEYDITAKIHQVLQNYTSDVREAVDRAVEECTQGLKKDLKSTSPMRTGQYAKSWAHKSVRNYIKGEKTNTVYNAKHYQLTHLLEKPHAGPFGYGLVSAHPHIAAAEKKWNEEFLRRCEEACKG